MLSVMIWWVVDAHKWFKGPQVNIEHAMIGANGNVIDAKDAGSDSGSQSGLDSSKLSADRKRIQQEP